MNRWSALTRFAVPAGAALMVVGCAVGPDYKRPEMPAPTQYRFVEQPDQAQSMADLPWWAGLRRSDAASADPRGADEES